MIIHTLLPPPRRFGFRTCFISTHTLSMENQFGPVFVCWDLSRISLTLLGRFWRWCSQTLSSCPTFPPPGWYLMLSMDPILERTFFRSGVGALIGRGVRGARGTAGFFSRALCLGTGGLVITRRRCVTLASPLVAAAGVAEEVVEAGRGRAADI